MQPQQNSNQNPYTIDYLNQIAPKKSSSFFDKQMKILVGVLAIALIAGVWMLLSSGGSESSNQSLLRTYLRIQKTNDISKSYQNKIKNSDLSAINSGLSVSLSSDEAKLKSQLESAGVKIPSTEKEKAASKIVAEVDKEAEELDSTLDDAFLNAVLDRTYTREMNYRLGVLNSSIKGVKAKTKSKSTIEALDNISQNLETSMQQFSDYSQSDK